MTLENGYRFTREDFPTLLRLARYPEQTARQSELMRTYFEAHLDAFDIVVFEYRVGEGLPPDPTHSDGTQRQTEFVTKLRIDILAWTGSRPSVLEFKERVDSRSLGQVLTYRTLLQKEFPDAPEAELVVVGRFGDSDSIGALTAHRVTVYLYEQADARGAAAERGV